MDISEMKAKRDLLPNSTKSILGLSSKIFYVIEKRGFVVNDTCFSKEDYVDTAIILAVLKDREVSDIFKKYSINYDEFIDTMRLHELRNDIIISKKIKSFINERVLRRIFSFAPENTDYKTLSRTWLLLEFCKNDAKIIKWIYDVTNKDKKYDFIKNLVNDLEKFVKKELESFKEEENKTKVFNVPRGQFNNFGKFIDKENYPLIGREHELKLMKIGLLKNDNSIMLIGPAGSGKTALVNHLALEFINGNVPERIKNKRIFSINSSSLNAGCTLVGMLEDRAQQVLNSLAKSNDTILFIDEVHTLIGLGKGKDGNNGFNDILKPYLTDGSIQMIGATTSDEYEEIVKEDTAFKTRFDRIDIKEPTNDETVSILIGLLPMFERKTNVKFPFNPEETNKIFEELALLSSDKNRRYGDISYNPRLSIGILKTIFAVSEYNNHKEVTIDDICESLELSDRIYESSRKTCIENIKSNFANSMPKQKILSFPNKF